MFPRVTGYSCPIDIPIIETALDIHLLLTFQSIPFLFMGLTVRLSTGHEYPITWRKSKRGGRHEYQDKIWDKQW